jgi:hypothetical protein
VKQCQTYRYISVAIFSGNNDHCKKNAMATISLGCFSVRSGTSWIHLMHKPPDCFISADNKPFPTLQIFSSSSCLNVTVILKQQAPS